LTDLHLVSVFIIGLLGGVHCVGMCGGIVGAFSVASGRRVIPVSAGTAAFPRATVADDLLRVAAYNAGRLASYAVAGAIAGGIAQGARTLSFLSPVQAGGYWLANLMLVALGLYLMNAWNGLARLEGAGQLLWRRVQPLMKRLLPVDGPGKAFALGGLWGWVPCGMVYSVLLSAMMTGSAASGAMVMLAFGAGTLPLLLTMGMLGSRLQAWSRKRGLRMAAGLLVLCFGLLGLSRAAGGISHGWLDALCLTPPAVHAQGAR
jgi:sulfite exporter TauE/SafE